MSDLLREAREWINAKLGGIPAPNGGELLARIDANLAAVPPPPAPEGFCKHGTPENDFYCEGCEAEAQNAAARGAPPPAPQPPTGPKELGESKKNQQNSGPDLGGES